MRRPTWETILSIIRSRWASSTNAACVASIFRPLDVDLVEPVHHDLGDRVVRQERFERPVPEDVVGDLLDEAALLVARERGLAGAKLSALDGLNELRQIVVDRRAEELCADPVDDRGLDPRLELGEWIALDPREASFAERRTSGRRRERSREAARSGRLGRPKRARGLARPLAVAGSRRTVLGLLDGCRHVSVPGVRESVFQAHACPSAMSVASLPARRVSRRQGRGRPLPSDRSPPGGLSTALGRVSPSSERDIARIACENTFSGAVSTSAAPRLTAAVDLRGVRRLGATGIRMAAWRPRAAGRRCRRLLGSGRGASARQES